MQTDEQQIRELVATWQNATRIGNYAQVLDLMTDDVVFLVPNQPPMTKDAFTEAISKQRALKIDSTSEIHEIKISGDLAFMWSSMTVIAAFPDDHPSVTRSGNTLSIFKKENGRWLLARDANMLTVAQNRG